MGVTSKRPDVCRPPTTIIFPLGSTTVVLPIRGCVIGVVSCQPSVVAGSLTSMISQLLMAGSTGILPPATKTFVMGVAPVSSINNEEKRTKLMKAIDYTNIKYGRNSLSIAQAGLKKRWNIKRQHSSKIDTACFDLLPTIKVA